MFRVGPYCTNAKCKCKMHDQARNHAQPLPMHRATKPPLMTLPTLSQKSSIQGAVAYKDWFGRPLPTPQEARLPPY